MKGRIIGEERALVGSEEEGWEIMEGVERGDDFWTNGKINIRCGKKGVEESGWKVWEDKAMVDTFDRKVVKREKVEKGERGEAEMEVDEEEEKEESGVDKRVKEEGKEENGKEVEVVDISSGIERGSRLGLMKEWRKEKKAKEKRMKDKNRKREVEGVVNRGKDRGMEREEILEMRQSCGDYKEMVSDVEYLLGIDKGLARCFVMDREIRKVVDMRVSGNSGRRVDVKRIDAGEKREEGRVEVRSKVVMEVGEGEREDLERVKGAKGGRTYGEVLRRVGSGIREGEELQR